MAARVGSRGVTLSSRRLTKQARAILAKASSPLGAAPRRNAPVLTRATIVILEHEGKSIEVECDGYESVLEAALDAGVENLSYDCKMGVCMTCPSRLKAGEVDQGGAMLSDDVVEKGFALLCCAVPVGDGVVIQTVTEEELLDEQLQGGAM